MIGITRLRFGDVWWRVRADAAKWLFDSCGLPLDRWLKNGQASVVKQGPHRTVYRVQLDGHSVFIKHHRVADARAMLSQWLQSSKGRREWNLAEQAADRDIPTFVPLALGEERRGGFVFENYLITEGIENVESLDRFVEQSYARLPADRQARIRRRLAESLASLVARVHDAGIRHPDLHSGNVLVRLGDNHALDLFLVDLHEARTGRQNDWRRSRRDLLALGVFFETMARGADRARFLRHYLELRPQLGLTLRGVAAELQRELRHNALNRWHRLTERCVANNRRYFFRGIGSTHGFAAAEFGEPAFMALLRDPDAPFRAASAEVLKDSASSAVVRVNMTVGGVTVPVIYKRFNCSKWLDPLRATVFYSPALRAWRGGHGLLVRRIPTPRPLAVIERTGWPFIRETYLVAQAIPDSMSLREYLSGVVMHLAPDAQRRRIRWIVEQIGGLVRRMHACNISHRDLKSANFLVTPATADTERPELFVIDLAGVQSWRRLPMFRRLQNVARVLVSLTSCPAVRRSDAVRFLRAYFPQWARDRAGWRELWNNVQSRAAQKIARNQRLQRPIT